MAGGMDKFSRGAGQPMKAVNPVRPKKGAINAVTQKSNSDVTSSKK